MKWPWWWARQCLLLEITWNCIMIRGKNSQSSSDDKQSIWPVPEGIGGPLPIMCFPLWGIMCCGHFQMHCCKMQRLIIIAWVPPACLNLFWTFDFFSHWFFTCTIAQGRQSIGLLKQWGCNVYKMEERNKKIIYLSQSTWRYILEASLIGCTSTYADSGPDQRRMHSRGRCNPGRTEKCTAKPCLWLYS